MMGLYSIRMRGAEGGPHEEGGRHISGAERIVEESDLVSVASSLIHRALHHSKGKSDFINILVILSQSSSQKSNSLYAYIVLIALSVVS